MANFFFVWAEARSGFRAEAVEFLNVIQSHCKNSELPLNASNQESERRTSKTKMLKFCFYVNLPFNAGRRDEFAQIRWQACDKDELQHILLKLCKFNFLFSNFYSYLKRCCLKKYTNHKKTFFPDLFLKCYILLLYFCQKK